MKYILRYLKIFSLAIVISYANSLISQESKLVKDYRFGIFAGANYLNHSTTIPIIWGADFCGIFEDGTNSSYQIGLNFSYNIYEQHLWADVRLNYANIPAYFEYLYTAIRLEKNILLPLLKRKSETTLSFAHYKQQAVLELE